jgi:hypothetical protein
MRLGLICSVKMNVLRDLNGKRKTRRVHHTSKREPDQLKISTKEIHGNTLECQH